MRFALCQIPKPYKRKSKKENGIEGQLHVLSTSHSILD